MQETIRFSAIKEQLKNSMEEVLNPDTVASTISEIAKEFFREERAFNILLTPKDEPVSERTKNEFINLMYYAVVASLSDKITRGIELQTRDAIRYLLTCESVKIAKYPPLEQICTTVVNKVLEDSHRFDSGVKEEYARLLEESDRQEKLAQKLLDYQPDKDKPLDKDEVREKLADNAEKRNAALEKAEEISREIKKIKEKYIEGIFNRKYIEDISNPKTSLFSQIVDFLKQILSCCKRKVDKIDLNYSHESSRAYSSFRGSILEEIASHNKFKPALVTFFVENVFTRLLQDLEKHLVIKENSLTPGGPEQTPGGPEKKAPSQREAETLSMDDDVLSKGSWQGRHSRKGSLDIGQDRKSSGDYTSVGSGRL